MELHPSPFIVFPSSHCSLPTIKRSPHTLAHAPPCTAKPATHVLQLIVPLHVEQYGI